MVDFCKNTKIFAIFDQVTKSFCTDFSLKKHLLGEIENAYCSKKRYYHNFSHIEKMIAQLSLFESEIHDFESLFLAILYHDVVYDAKKHDNEEKSADFAQKQLLLLNFIPEKIEKIRKLILSTKKHLPFDDNFDSKLLLDLDLAILASDFVEYQNYSKKIRLEYKFVLLFLYTKKRKEVLLRFLDREKIYFTSYFFEHFEQRARENIRHEIELSR